MHEKGLQRQIGVGKLVSSQEQRALLVPLINRWSTAGFVAPSVLRSVSEISSCFFGPRPWHIEIRHRLKQTSTINLFGFETLELKIRRFKLWKATVSTNYTVRASEETFRTVVFGTLVGTRGRCLLGEPNRRRSFWPGHAPPRPDPPAVCPDFGFGRSYLNRWNEISG